ncbi:hypothetical protein HYU50_04100 [Candidatus Woesearchaeota archaeon]|nr:hypothetical protein [Candidatus Woesearchaeota archaeon]
MHKALVVDDKGIDGRLLYGLTERKFSVIGVNHPHEAMSILAAGTKPYLVISDVYEHPYYNGIEFARRARDLLGDKASIFLWSGHYGNNESNGMWNIDEEFLRLYLDGIVDGFTTKINGKGEAMLDLIDAPHFLAFAAKYGIQIFDGVDRDTLLRFAELEIQRKTGVPLKLD